uniref:Uncharacterized protein n=1 Tax=Ciona savignyi TaxID=51511 RepID=H2ZBX5_CIOSA
MRELRAKIRICNDDLLDIQLRSGERDKLVEDLLYKPIHHFNTTLTSYQEELDKIKQRRKIQQQLEISDFEYLCKVAGLKAK